MPNLHIHLRAATLSDLELLKQWDQQPHVQSSNPNDSWDWDAELGTLVAWREQWIAEINHHPIGFVQIIDPSRDENQYWGSMEVNVRALDIWIGDPEFLGKGYGTEIMKICISRCFSDPNVLAILVDPIQSNTRAHKFYERLGFRHVETRQFGEDICYVYRLDRDFWQMS